MECKVHDLDQEQNQEQLTQENSDASEKIDTSKNVETSQSDEDDIFRDYDQEKIEGNFLKYFPNL
jgi:hypothetical protein